jgi:acetyl-CoA carboxylase carboxyltransferase component
MSGRAYKPRFLFSWPSSKCSVMGTEQLAGVMDQVARDGAARFVLSPLSPYLLLTPVCTDLVNR